MAQFPSTPQLDAFNRATGAIGANWGVPLYTGYSDPTIDTGVVIGPGSLFSGAYWAPQKFFQSEAYLTLTGSNFSQVTLYNRIADLGLPTISYYDLIYEAGVDAILDRTHSGTPTTIATWPVRPVDGNKLGIRTRTVGPSIEIQCWMDIGAGWKQMGSVTDLGAVATYPLLAPPGYIGFRQYASGTTSRSFGNFGGGESNPTTFFGSQAMIVR